MIKLRFVLSISGMIYIGEAYILRLSINAEIQKYVNASNKYYN